LSTTAYGEDMNHISDPGDSVNYWPGLIDLVTSALIVFLFSTFLQTHLNLASVEAAKTHARQERFLNLFRTEFVRQIEDKTVETNRTLDFLQITFSDRVLFDSGDYHLKAEGEEILARCAKVLVEAGESGFEQIQVEGHTDDARIWRLGYPANNWELSAARAISVVQFLSRGRGLPAGVFSANGYASFRPVASNDSDSGRARNRRIEIRVFFAGQQHREHGGTTAAAKVR
jgi:flagellar motor protein MotB